ncbi:ANTAR domain-containing protein [Streptomyces echinatus]|uniref:ANTAR domain-containing protein n=1 Tax=Streptomyces echinatus TaxID=67293 RepID=A0A7W9UV99_9ACTN|nr:ANTAR domain-containing protein [Streptomyces echinatus]MBB5932565.1 hypothetical protein [Streptomyces echinatus]
MGERDDDGREAALQEEIEQLKAALESRAVIDQAIGVVVAHGRLPSRQAREVLIEVSQHTNTKLREVATHLVQWPMCAWLPPEIRTALDAALQRRTSRDRTEEPPPASSS